MTGTVELAVESLQVVLSSMMGVNASPVARPHAGAGQDDFVIARVDISGASRLTLWLAMSIGTAQRLIAAMVGVNSNRVDWAMIVDGATEILNIVAGNVKAKVTAEGMAFNHAFPRARVETGHRDLPVPAAAEQTRCLETDSGALLALWATRS